MKLRENIPVHEASYVYNENQMLLNNTIRKGHATQMHNGTAELDVL